MRGFSLMLCIVPSVGMALSEFQGPELQQASGLFALMRNLGGAVGIAVVNTWLQDNARIQAARFSETLGQSRAIVDDALGRLTHMMGAATPDPAHAELLASGVLARIVSQQALTVAFDDVFRVMAWVFVAALAMVPFVKRSSGDGRSADANAH
jgi:DHA2 family multidrug resistance protein